MVFLLSEAQMRRTEPFFPLSHGIPRVDDRRVIGGIVFAIKNGLRWRRLRNPDQLRWRWLTSISTTL